MGCYNIRNNSNNYYKYIESPLGTHKSLLKGLGWLRGNTNNIKHELFHFLLFLRIYHVYYVHNLIWSCKSSVVFLYIVFFFFLFFYIILLYFTFFRLNENNWLLDGRKDPPTGHATHQYYIIKHVFSY